MIAASRTDLDRARKWASTAHILAIVAAVLLVLVIIAQYVIPGVMSYADADGAWHERLHPALRLFLMAQPLVLFVGAVLRLRKALELYGDGAFFSAKAAGHVAAAGGEAMFALLAHVLIVPTVLAWIEFRGGIHFSGDPIMLGMFLFAFFVMIVGHVLRAAAAIKAENDAIV
jgi:hypothetical protein